MATLSFLGAAGTVTGSRHLLELRGRRWLVDCGMFQGRKDLRLRNWGEFPVEPSSIDAVFLTHAHIDHIGYLPKLVAAGFGGPVHCTRATAELAAILLPDSARLQEEEAAWANKKGFSKHSPAKPLYTEEDAERALARLQPVDYGDEIHPEPGVRMKYRDAGHILGAAHLDVKVGHEGTRRKIVFGGDLGRPGDPVLKDPVQAYGVDYLVLESTYGDRLHGPTVPARDLAAVVHAAVERGGALVIPAFAVGRTQTLLYLIRELEAQGAIPELPVYVDSPMAVGALKVFEARVADLRLSARVEAVRGTRLFTPRHLHLCETRDQSKAVNNVRGPCIILAASGMLSGGRILHHLQQRLPDPKTTLLFVGYQAEGTRGRDLKEGKPEVKIFGGLVPARAKVESIDGFSGHSDYEEILAWLGGFPRPPERTFLVHGEPAASAALRERIREHLGWDVEVAEEGTTAELALG